MVLFLQRLLLCALGIVFIAFSRVDASCPNWCNQRGICTSPNEDGYCICNPGYTGEDCGQRLCPSGFDPLTVRNNARRRTVRLTTGAMSGVLMGKFEFSFAGSTVTLNADANQLDSDACTHALRGLKSVQEISCIRDSVNDERHSGVYLIRIDAFPTQPHMNNVHFHNGNPLLELFGCKTTLVDEEEAQAPFCDIEDVIASNVPVYGECAMHGHCAANLTHAACECSPGYKDIACDNIRDDKNINSTVHVSPFFTGSLLHLEAVRDAHSEFNLFQTRISGENVTTIRGDKRLIHRGDLDLLGGAVISAVSAGSVVRANLHSDIPTLTTQSLPHILATSAGETVFSLSAQGALATRGTFSAANGSFLVDESSVVTARNVLVGESLTVSGAVSVRDSLSLGERERETVRLSPQGLSLSLSSHNASTQRGLLDLRSTLEDPGKSATLLYLQANAPEEANHPTLSLIKAVVRTPHTHSHTHSLSHTQGGERVALELTAEGVLRTHALRVLSGGGVSVTAGGVDVLAGGVSVRGGLSVHSGALSLSQSATHPLQVKGILMERLDDSTLSSAEGKAERQASVSSPFLSLSAQRESYRGDMLSLSSVRDREKERDRDTERESEREFNFLSISQRDRERESEIETERESEKSEEKVLMKITQSGRIESQSGARFTSSAVEVESALRLSAALQLSPVTLTPQRRRRDRVRERQRERERRLREESESTSQRESKKKISKRESNADDDDEFEFFVRIPFNATYVVVGPLLDSEDALTHARSTGDSDDEVHGNTEIDNKIAGKKALHVVVEFESLPLSHSDRTTSEELALYHTESERALHRERKRERETHRGRFVVLSNTHARNTVGSARVPAHSTVLMIHNGEKWCDIEALRAPVAHLTGVESFSANNDLNIGANVSFAAGRFVSALLRPQSVLFVNAAHALTDSERFTFSRGTLSVPALRTDKLTQDLDVKGHDLKNALLTNARLKNAIISAQEIVLNPARSGLAFFDEKGSLSVSLSLSVDPRSGQLSITRLSEDLDAQQNVISNAVLRSVVVQNASEIEVRKLYISDNSTGSQINRNLALLDEKRNAVKTSAADVLHAKAHFNAGALCVVDESGAVSVAPKTALSLSLSHRDTERDRERETLFVSDLKVDALHGTTRCDKAVLEEVHIRGGVLSALQEVRTHSLAVTSLAVQPQSPNGSIAKRSVAVTAAAPRRVVVVDDEGVLHSLPATTEEVLSTQYSDDNARTLHVPIISVEDIRFTREEIDFNNKTLKNVRLDPLSVSLSQRDALKAVSLSLSRLADTQRTDAQRTLAVASREGDLHALHEVYVETEKHGDIVRNSLFLENVKVRAKDVNIAGSLALPFLRNTSNQSNGDVLLSLDESASVRAVSEVSLSSLSLRGALHILPGAEVVLPVLPKIDKTEDEGNIASLLVVDGKGRLQSLSRSHSLAGDAHTHKEVDAALRALSVDTLSVREEIVAPRVRVTQLQLTTPSVSAVEEKEKESSSQPGNVLIVDKTGEVRVAPFALFDALNGTLSLREIRPLSTPSTTSSAEPSQPSLTITHAHISHSALSHTEILDAPFVSTRTLLATEEVELQGSVVVGGALSVRGQVFGSGPYVDSSDRVLKRDVRPLEGALEMVKGMQAVTYHFKTDEFPEKHFPETEQLGFIAQDIERVLPQVVVTDKDTGLKSVAYGHTCAVAVAAIQELLAERETERAAWQREINAMKEEMLRMRNKMDSRRFTHTEDSIEPLEF